MKVVVTARNGTREFECEPGEKILHAGLRSGVELPYECATGTCGTCKARLTSGRTESEWPEAPGRKYFKSEGDLLTCQSVAHDDCALEVGPLKSREPNTSAPRVPFFRETTWAPIRGSIGGWVDRKPTVPKSVRSAPP